MVSFITAQHYIFIEAEGQQPFYLKRGGETFSSTGTGFIILSKIDQKEIDFIIGFPNRLYPEVSFKVDALHQDRGFALKMIDGKAWVLVDRLSSVVIAGGLVDKKQTTSEISKSSTGFAELLADATGDKTLLERVTTNSAPVEKNNSVNTKTKTNSVVSKTQSVPKQANKSNNKGIVRSYIQSDDSMLLRIVYFDKGVKDSWDTIVIDIEKKLSGTLSDSSLKSDGMPAFAPSITSISDLATLDSAKQKETTSVSVGCSNPIALPKDLKDLQRKMAKATSFEAQLDLATKAFNEKCFTTKQVKELGTFFWEEQNKLTFFGRLRKYVADPSLYGELEQSFLQEGSKKAFREMLNK